MPRRTFKNSLVVTSADPVKWTIPGHRMRKIRQQDKGFPESSLRQNTLFHKRVKPSPSTQPWWLDSRPTLTLVLSLVTRTVPCGFWIPTILILGPWRVAARISIRRLESYSIRNEYPPAANQVELRSFTMGDGLPGPEVLWVAHHIDGGDLAVITRFQCYR